MRKTNKKHAYIKTKRYSLISVRGDEVLTSRRVREKVDGKRERERVIGLRGAKSMQIPSRWLILFSLSNKQRVKIPCGLFFLLFLITTLLLSQPSQHAYRQRRQGGALHRPRKGLQYVSFSVSAVLFRSTLMPTATCRTDTCWPLSTMEFLFNSTQPNSTFLIHLFMNHSFSLRWVHGPLLQLWYRARGRCKKLQLGKKTNWLERRRSDIHHWSTLISHVRHRTVRYRFIFCWTII